MKVKEEIMNAIDAIIPIVPPNNGRTYEQALMATGFEAGAGWAYKHPVNAWHDASEEPQDKNERILSYSEYFDCFFLDFPNYLMIKDGGQKKNWETVVLRNKMSKWAYVSDLFPKGGKEKKN